MNTETNIKNGFSILDVIMLLLSIFVIVSLIATSFFELDGELKTLLDYMDNIICVVFLVEFGWRFYKAENKLKFMKWGWIDLVSSIPSIDYFRAGRVFRVVRLLRVVRAIKSTKFLLDFFVKDKVKGVFTTLFTVSIVMVLFSSIAILEVEKDPNSNIKTAEDALWWSYTTITTVGYGDKFPVTTEGRLIAMGLMTIGVGLFGAFTAFLTQWFVKKEG